jgi:hypothetical protein
MLLVIDNVWSGADLSPLRLLPGHATPAYLIWEG